MNRRVVAAAWWAATALWAAPLTAQHPSSKYSVDEGIRRQYESIDASIVRVRTIASLEHEAFDPHTGERTVVSRPMSVYGTGVVIGEAYLDGRWEYLVLTNHHVADASNYVISEGGFLRENKHNMRAEPTVPEQSYLVREEREDVMEDDILLEEIARNPRGDMTLLRTVGATRELPSFHGRIGYRDGQVAPGTRVITSGFPYTGDKVLAMGSVKEVDRLHHLGQPHEDFIVDLPVERGQSGSPVFMVESVETPSGTSARFTLIGLLHASEKGEKYMVPYELWKESLVGLPEMLVQRLIH